MGIVCQKHNVSERTFARWLKDLDTNVELAKDVSLLRQPKAVAWSEQLQRAKERALNTLLKDLEAFDAKSPEGIRCKAEVFRIIADNERADKVASAYIDSVANAAAGTALEAGPRVTLLTSGFSIEADDHVSEAEQASAGSVEPSGFEEPQNAGSSVG